MAKETFVFAKLGSGRAGLEEYCIAAHFSRESCIPNFCFRCIPNIVFSFFFFSIVNYQVITLTATEPSKHP